MDMAGEKRIAASREDVWRALNDPEVLKASIPGCEELEKVSDTEFTSRITAKVGPIKAKFSGKVELSDINEPVSYRINGEGQGGVAGFAKGGASVFLDADGAEATVLRYQVEANVGGKLAQLGTRLIDSTASKLADKFFEQFSDTVAPTEAADDTPPAETPKAGGFMGKLMGRGKTTAAAPPTPEISAAADAPGLVVTQEGPIALLSFDRPEKRNAMTLAMWRRLAQEVRRLGADDSVRAIVLTGRHGDFCVGADISEFGEVRGTAEQTAAYEQAVEDGGIAIAEAPKPTIAAIEGYCIGGGLGLAVACDFRIAYPDATLFVPSAKMSIVYGVRETQNILVLVGLSQAKRLLFSGARVGAEESRQIGLIDRVARDPLNEARAVANSMAANAPLAIAGSKYILNGLALGKGGLDLERAHELITRASESDDYREGRAAFAERRKPDFKGR